MDKKINDKKKLLKIIIVGSKKKSCCYKLQMLPLTKFDTVEKNEKVIHCT